MTTDWNDWAILDLWIEPESVRICCGIDPGERYLSDDQRDAIDGARVKIQRAVDAGALRCRQAIGEPRQFRPADAIDWARTRFKTLPQELVDAVDAMRQPPAAPTPQGDDLDARERVSLLCIIGALAHAAKIDLSEPYKAGEIVAKLLPDGTSLTARTIGNHLKAVREATGSRKT